MDDTDLEAIEGVVVDTFAKYWKVLGTYEGKIGQLLVDIEVDIVKKMVYYVQFQREAERLEDADETTV